MKTEEKICLVITGKQFLPQTEQDPVVTVQKVLARYYQKDNARYFFYEEVLEGHPQKLQTRVKYKNGCLEVERKSAAGSGAGSHRMVFEKDKSYLTQYPTPYGVLPLDIETELVEFSEEKKENDAGVWRLKLKVCYVLKQAGEPIAEYELCMETGLDQ